MNHHLIINSIIFLCVFCGILEGTDPLPSWNEGPAKQSIIDFVNRTTKEGSPDFVPLDERIATFDQDGTLWVEHPMYTQIKYCLDQIPGVVKEKPELKNQEPFSTVLSGNQKAIDSLSLQDLEKILVATIIGKSIEEFQQGVRQWISTAKDERWGRLYTELTYLPMLEVINYLRENGYKTYIVTGGGQDFVRVYAEKIYGIPPEQVVGTATGIKFSYQDGQSSLMKEPKLLLNDNNAGKPEGIHLIIGRRPTVAFGNSVGDKEMLEYTFSGEGKRLAMLVLHDDPIREYAYGPAEGLPNTKVGTFTQALYNQAKQNNWIVISIKNDWNRVFSFDQ